MDTNIHWQHAAIGCIGAMLLGWHTAHAGDLELADNALEVIAGIEPNIMILTDDSGSMDWGLMTPESSGLMFRYASAYYYSQPANGASGNPPAPNWYTWVAPSEDYLKSYGVAAPYEGVWRARNKDYNKIYYNPEITYIPWAGLDSTGTPFAAVSPTAAPYNPYYPQNGALDLTTTTSFSTYCSTPDCWDAGLTSVFTVTDYYPARYHTWDDSNSSTPANAGNGVVDLDDDHQLIEIRTNGCNSHAQCPSQFVRPKFDDNTRIGRSDCSTDNGDGTVTCSYKEEIQNFANWFSYYRKRDLAAKASMSFVIADNETARIGYATINKNNNVITRVASMNISPENGNKKFLLDKLFQTVPSGGTPLRTKLDEVGRYFECVANDIFGSSGTSLPQTGDYKSCPILPAPAGTCQKNYTVLVTDGFYNGDPPSLGNTDSNGSGNFDGGATADTYSDTLADVAMHYYERDLHSLTDDVFATANDIDRYPLSSGYPTDAEGNPVPMHQHMSTYTAGFGVQGTLTGFPSDPVASFAWPNPGSGNAHKIDDMAHAAYNGRGEFLTANDPLGLVLALQDIFEEIGESDAGSSSAVAFNTQNVESGALVFRAFFDTKFNTGDLIAQQVSLDGAINPNVQWSAAEKLDSKADTNSDSRIIFTYKNLGNTSSTGIPFQWSSLTSGSGSQQELLNTPQPSNVTNPVGENRLNWLRGHSIHEGENTDNGEFRQRGDYSLLGDIIHSAPVFVGEPPFTGRNNPPYPVNGDSQTGNSYPDFKTTHKNRQQLVYVGSNDGMLHAFDANNGVEEFAYVPNIVIQELSQLTDPDYEHQYYVDITPSVNDVYMSGWKTVLVGGLGKGGKGYFALDITDPTSFNTEANAANNVLWEFTEADDGSVGNSDLGYTYSKPIIAMSNASSNGEQRWVAIFGNGYNSTSAAGDAALYILFLDGGLDGDWSDTGDFIKISTGNGKAESSDGSTPNGIAGVGAMDSDQNGTVDYIYAGDLQGNVYRFDLSASSSSSWDLAGTLYSAKYQDNANKVQAITNAPVVVKHPTEAGFIVTFGTGTWMQTSDVYDTEIHSVYGVWDTLKSNVDTVDFNMLVQQQFINQINREHGFAVRTATNNAVNWKDNGSNKVKGWYIDLDMPAAGASSGIEFPGERAVRQFILRGDILFFNTVIPRTNNTCSIGAGGFEMALNPLTGGSGSKIIFDLDGDGHFDLEDNVGNNDGDAYIVVGKRFDDATPTDSSFIGDIQVTQTSDKEIRTSKTNTGDHSGEGRHSWREVEF